MHHGYLFFFSLFLFFFFFFGNKRSVKKGVSFYHLSIEACLRYTGAIWASVSSKMLIAMKVE